MISKSKPTLTNFILSNKSLPNYLTPPKTIARKRAGNLEKNEKREA